MEGKFIPQEPASWPIAMRHFEGRRVVVDIEAYRERRTDRQSRRYWGMIVPLAGDLLSKTRDIPLSKESVHYVLKSAFLGTEETPLGLVPTDSRTLTTVQFCAFCDKVELWLMENGYCIPERGEPLQVGA